MPFRRMVSRSPSNAGVLKRTRSSFATLRSRSLSGGCGLRFVGLASLAGRRRGCGVAGRIDCSCAGSGEVTATSAHLVAATIGEFNFDAVVFSVSDEIGWAISDGVLIAQFVADVLERLVQVVDVIGKKGAAAGFFTKIFQDFVTLGEMALALCPFVRVGLGKLNPLRAGADGVDDHVGALGHFDGLGAS